MNDYEWIAAMRQTLATMDLRDPDTIRLEILLNQAIGRLEKTAAEVSQVKAQLEMYLPRVAALEDLKREVARLKTENERLAALAGARGSGEPQGKPMK
jgi:hypothetical protein